MTKVIIYKASKSPTQSGKYRPHSWLIENIEAYKISVDPLMDWIGEEIVSNSIKLKFTNLESALEYAKRENLDYSIVGNNSKKKLLKGYADNFKYNRIKSEQKI